MPVINSEAAFLLLIVALMIVPRMLQRFAIPAPLTSFALGMAAMLLITDMVGGDLSTTLGSNETLALLATLGISSLFLFAGLEIDVADFKRGLWPLVNHVALRGLSLIGVGWLAITYLDTSWQVGALLGLALLTPSTGFILEALPGMGLTEDERYWVRMKAVSGELFALLVMFIVLQSGSVTQMAWSSAALVGMIVGLPLLFIALGRYVVPHARGSEFSLLLMVGVIAADLTYHLGVYYLVGAFLAGFVARLLRTRMPLLATDDNLRAIEKFASFFVPFYFFYKGMSVPTGALTQQALLLGVGLTAATLPFRIGVVWGQRRLIRGETVRSSLRVAAALTPTLIFTLVIAGILRERFQISDTLYGALLIYAGLSTMLPSLVLKRPVAFEQLMPASAQARSKQDAPTTVAPITGKD
jgi:Kef-type K+ transport system membrane component KefB